MTKGCPEVSKVPRTRTSQYIGISASAVEIWAQSKSPCSTKPLTPAPTVWGKLTDHVPTFTAPLVMPASGCIQVARAWAEMRH